MNARFGITAGLVTVALTALGSPKPADAAVFGKPAVAHAAAVRPDGGWNSNGNGGNNDRNRNDGNLDRRGDRNDYNRDRGDRYFVDPRFRDAHRDWNDNGYWVQSRDYCPPPPPRHHGGFVFLGIRL